MQLILHRWTEAPLWQIIVSAVRLASSTVHPHTMGFEAVAKQTGYAHNAFCCWGVGQVCQWITFKNTFVDGKQKSRPAVHPTHLKPSP